MGETAIALGLSIFLLCRTVHTEPSLLHTPMCFILASVKYKLCVILSIARLSGDPRPKNTYVDIKL